MSNLGTDFDCYEDITDDWALADSAELAFMQAVFRILDQRKQTLFYDGDYGLGVHGFLLESALTLEHIAAEITAALLKDERVKTIAITGAIDDLTVAITPHGSSTPMSLTLAIDAVAGTLAIV